MSSSKKVFSCWEEILTKITNYLFVLEAVSRFKSLKDLWQRPSGKVTGTLIMG